MVNLFSIYRFFVFITTSIPFAVGRPGGRFSKAPKSFRARKAIFRSCVEKRRSLYARNFLYEGNFPSSLEYVNKTALYLQGSRFCNGFTARKVSGAFEKRPPGLPRLPRMELVTNGTCSSQTEIPKIFVNGN